MKLTEEQWKIEFQAECELRKLGWNYEGFGMWLHSSGTRRTAQLGTALLRGLAYEDSLEKG